MSSMPCFIIPKNLLRMLIILDMSSIMTLCCTRKDLFLVPMEYIMEKELGW